MRHAIALAKCYWKNDWKNDWKTIENALHELLFRNTISFPIRWYTHFLVFRKIYSSQDVVLKLNIQEKARGYAYRVLPLLFFLILYKVHNFTSTYSPLISIFASRANQIMNNVELVTTKN